MKPLDLPIITFHEKVLQWIWDHLGIGRIWVMRLSGGAAVLSDFVSAGVRLDGGANHYLFALGFILTQGIEEDFSRRYRNNNNLRILQTRELGILSAVRGIFALALLLTAPDNLMNGLYYEVASNIAFLAFLYFAASVEPTEPPKFLGRERQWATQSL